MKKIYIFFVIVLFLFSFIAESFARVRVRSYTRKNGTRVSSHYRSSPDRSRSNNWSTKGNVNPYTGKKGYKKVYRR